MLSETQKYTLNALAKAACERYPHNVARIGRAVEIILDGGVNLLPDGRVEVTNHHHVYRMVGATCPCVDFQQKNAPDGHCKHRLAACLYRRLMASPAMAWTENDYVASAGGFDGIARVQEDGSIHFHPYTKAGFVLPRHAVIQAHEVALGPKCLAVEAQYGPIKWEYRTGSELEGA